MTVLRRALDLQRARRVERQDLSAFAVLIKNPGNLATGIVLPANATLFLTTTVALAAAVVQVTAGPRDIGARPGPAGAYSWAGWFERGCVLKKKGTAQGTVRAFVQDSAGAYHLIAQG